MLYLLQKVSSDSMMGRRSDFYAELSEEGLSEQRLPRLPSARREIAHSIPFHYHDFHKIILFLGGDVDYIIEGNSYHLQPDDIVFVSPVRFTALCSVETARRRRTNASSSTSPPTSCSASTSAPSSPSAFAAAREQGRVMHQLPNRSHDLLFHMDKLEKQPMAKGSPMGCTQRSSLLNS